jgi:asparagine synthetase B (glutamine-hydrolysing)
MKVLLDGQGADEAFAGYSSFFGPLLTGLVMRMEWRRAFAEFAALRRHHGFAARTAAGACCARSRRRRRSACRPCRTRS